MQEDQMWIDIGPEKTSPLKGYAFEIDLSGHQFFKRGQREPWMLTFEHVRDMPLATLRTELFCRAR